MPSKVKTEVGDIFEVGISAELLGFGQVVMKPEKEVFFVVIFAATSVPRDAVDLNGIVHSQIVLAGNTFDAKFVHRHWPIIGNISSNLSEIALPKYKCAVNGRVVVETLDLSRRRFATPQEESSLPLRTYAAPVNFELALKALHGIGGWQKMYDDLRYERLRLSSQVAV